MAEAQRVQAAVVAAHTGSEGARVLYTATHSLPEPDVWHAPEPAVPGASSTRRAGQVAATLLGDLTRVGCGESSATLVRACVSVRGASAAAADGTRPSATLPRVYPSPQRKLDS